MQEENQTQLESPQQEPAPVPPPSQPMPEVSVPEEALTNSREKVNEAQPLDEPAEAQEKQEVAPEAENPPSIVQEAQPPPPPEAAVVEPVPTTAIASESNIVARLLEKAREKIQARKQKKLAKILDLLAQKGRVTNRDIQKLLRVSNATVTRYLDELERQGKIRQVGSRKGSYYELVK